MFTNIGINPKYPPVAKPLQIRNMNQYTQPTGIISKALLMILITKNIINIYSSFICYPSVGNIIFDIAAPI